jgi:integrase
MRQWRNRDGNLSTVWVYDYRDNSGKRRSLQFEKRREAEAARTKIASELVGGIHTANRASVTVEKAARLWYDACEARIPPIERTSLDNYRRAIAQINAEIGAVKLNQLTAARVKAFGERVAADALARGQKGSKAQRLMATLGTLLADAQERGLVAQNVVFALSKRKGGERLKPKLEVGVDIPTPDEIRRIVAQLDDPRFVKWRTILLTFIFTGMRASEVRGLPKSNVDLDRGELHVRQRADAYKKIGAPKSKTSRRTVPLIPTLISALREHMLSVPKTEHNLVFPTKNGDVYDDSTISEHGLKPVQVAAGIVGPDGKAKYSLHKFRHFYASLCINRRVDGGLELPIKVVSERLGHATVGMTSDTYGHLFPRGDDRAELAAADAMFFDNVPPPRPATATVLMLKPGASAAPAVREVEPMAAPIPAPALDPVPAVGSASPLERARAAILAYPELDNQSLATKIGVSRQTISRARGAHPQPTPVTAELTQAAPGLAQASAPAPQTKIARVEAAVRANPEMSIQALVDHLGVDRQAVRLARRRLGKSAEWVAKRMAGMKRVEAAVLANPGMVANTLAKQLGVDKGTVLKARHRLGIKSAFIENRTTMAARVNEAVHSHPDISSPALAKLLGVSTKMVKRARRKLPGAKPDVENRSALGQFVPGPRYTAEMKRVDAAVLANPGMSIPALAKLLGVGITSIKRAKRRLKSGDSPGPQS